MSAASSASWSADTDPAIAAVSYGVGLIRVLRGFTRHVLRLGRVTQGVIAGLKRKGVDHTTPACGYDILNIITVLRRTLMMADALRVRLMTPAVALAVTPPPRTGGGGGGGGGGKRLPPGEKDPDDPLALILWRRTHPHTKEGFANTIATLSDQDVVEKIYTDLMEVALVLRALDQGSRIFLLAYKAVLAVCPELAELAKRKSARAARPEPENAPAPAGAAEAPAVEPVPREVGRGPP